MNTREHQHSLKTVNTPAEGVRYSSKLLAALNKFTGNLSVEVSNPLVEKYGKAYDYLISADAMRYREDIDAAMAQYKQAIGLHHDFTEAYVGMGKCLRRKGESMAAIQYFKQALAQNPFSKDVHIELAKSYNECGYIDLSIRHYEKAVRLDPSHLEARFGLALIVELNGDLAYAADIYRKIIQMDEEFMPAYNNLGSIYLRQGAYADAERTFRELTLRAPDFGRGFLGLALTLDKCQRSKEALKAYYQVLSKKPSSRNVEFVKRRIVALNKLLGRSRTRRNTTLVRVK